MASPASSMPTVAEPDVASATFRPTTVDSAYHSSSSSSSSSVHGDPLAVKPPRPRLGTRKSSGTIIVPRDSPCVELKEGDEVFDDDDARAMSPRRNSEDLEKMSQDARAQLSQYVIPNNEHRTDLTISPCRTPNITSSPLPFRV